MDDRDLWGMIDARPVVFPARAHEVSMALLRYQVPTGLLRSVLEEEPFRFVVEPDGSVRVTLLLVDYRHAEWGPSAYAGLTVPLHPVGDGLPALRLCRGVTNAAFTDEVMYWAFGVSGALGDLEVTYRPDEVTVDLRGDGGSDGLAVRLPRRVGPAGGPPIVVDVYTCDGDVPRQVTYELDAPVLQVPPADVRIDAGTGPLADAVRALGLTRPPVSCHWGEGLRMSIQRPLPLLGVVGASREPGASAPDAAPAPRPPAR